MKKNSILILIFSIFCFVNIGYSSKISFLRIFSDDVAELINDAIKVSSFEESAIRLSRLELKEYSVRLANALKLEGHIKLAAHLKNTQARVNKLFIHGSAQFKKGIIDIDSYMDESLHGAVFSSRKLSKSIANNDSIFVALDLVRDNVNGSIDILFGMIGKNLDQINTSDLSSIDTDNLKNVQELYTHAKVVLLEKFAVNLIVDGVQDFGTNGGLRTFSVSSPKGKEEALIIESTIEGFNSLSSQTQFEILEVLSDLVRGGI